MDQRCFFNVHERWSKKPRTLSWRGSKPLGIVWLNASGDIALVTVLYSNDTFTVPVSIPHTEKESLEHSMGEHRLLEARSFSKRRRVGNILKPEPKSETRLRQNPSSSGTSGEEPACRCRRHNRRGFSPWVRKILWRSAWKPTPVFLPGESSWTEEPGGPQSIGSQRLRHDWSNLVCTQGAVKEETVTLPTNQNLLV